MAYFSLLAELAFGSALLLVLYAYLGYPLLIWVLARVFGNRGEPPEWDESALPTVSVLIACHNEAAVIGLQINNTLKLDYPREKLEIAIASDGSTDATNEIVGRFPEVRLLDYGMRRGKAAVLNSSIPTLTGDIVLLSDANTFLEAGSLRCLVRWFGDPEVGVVCGRLVLTDPVTGTNVDSLYWKYENFLKKYESRLGALLGANGGIYAIRRELFSPIPDNTIIDDFVIPLQARLRHGCALLYEQRAAAHEETPPSIGSEFRRRSRIGAGGFQCIPLLWRLLWPGQGWVAFTFFSHKVLRWLCPFLMVGLLVGNAALVDEGFYTNLLIAQAGFYACAILGNWLPARPRFLKFLRLPTMFVSMNAALLIGFWRWLRGGQKGIWQRTERSLSTVQAGEAIP